MEYINKEITTKYWVIANKWFISNIYLTKNTVYWNLELKLKEDKEPLLACRYNFILTEKELSWNLKTAISNRIITLELEWEMNPLEKIDFTNATIN